MSPHQSRARAAAKDKAGLDGGAAQAPRVNREAMGFAPDRLARIAEVFERDIADGKIAGAVLLASRQSGPAFTGVFGFEDIATRAPMREETVFRLASLTKPVVSVAALTLVEEGAIQLTDPVAMYFPQLGDRVVVDDASPGGRRACRDITVHDLLRHTSGYTYGEFGAGSLHQLYRDAALLDPTQSNADLLEKAARLPLLHEPGTTFEYGVSTDILGALVEIVAGVRLDVFIDRRIARPLGLKSFTFHAPETGMARPLPHPEEQSAYLASACALNERKWISGGGGLCSNAGDYLRFALMLQNGGALDDARILSRKTVELMTSDALPPNVSYGDYVDTLGFIAPTAQMGQGFGLGVTVRTARGRNPLPGSIGDFGWAGVLGSYFWVDPVEDLACVLVMQASRDRAQYRALARTLVYQALEDAF